MEDIGYYDGENEQEPEYDDNIEEETNELSSIY